MLCLQQRLPPFLSHSGLRLSTVRFVHLCAKAFPFCDGMLALLPTPESYSYIAGKCFRKCGGRFITLDMHMKSVYSAR